jgi:uracil-DNA glycosylase family protein
MPTPRSSAAQFVPEHRTLATLAAALPSCKGCAIYLNGSRPVAGQGPAKAQLMLVGEQPGDQEELQGSPFVGPAGAELDRILEELQIPRAALFLTNAVKHFKFVVRGKRRLHESPRIGEVSACRPWLLSEIEIVQPKAVVCLGASASKSLLGSGFALLRDHGKRLATPWAENVFATVHPSAILRAPDAERRRELHAMLSTDLQRAWMTIAEAG